MGTRRRAVGQSILAGALLALVAAAQAQTVELQAPRTELHVNEAGEVTVIVQQHQNAVEQVTLPDVPNATLRLSAPYESTSMQIINNRTTVSRSVVYRVEIVPQTAGELVLAPIKLRVDGRELQTREVRFVVKPSDADQYLLLEVTAGRKRLYVGQRAKLVLTIWVKAAYSAPVMWQQVELVHIDPFPRNARPSVEPGTPPGRQGSWYAYLLTTDFVADHPGPLDLGTLEVAIAYPMATGTRNLRASARLDNTEVVPLPVEGQPPHFNGAVGLFAIDTAAKPTSVRVGDPIELTIELYGDGPVDVLPPPLLDANAELTRNFRLPTDALRGEMQNSRRRFKVTLRALRPDVSQIPALEYPYFDPTAERYVIARSAPLPLQVSASAEVVAPSNTAAGTQPGGPALQPLDGLSDIETRPDRVLASATSLSSNVVSALLVGPPLLFGGAWALVAWRSARIGHPARRRRQALAAARRRIQAARSSPAAELGNRLSAAIAEYLADRTGDPAGRFVGEAAADYLAARGVSAQALMACRQVLRECDEASFASGATCDPVRLCEAAQRCLAALEREPL
jgi:hypothetical protein